MRRLGEWNHTFRDNTALEIYVYRVDIFSTGLGYRWYNHADGFNRNFSENKNTYFVPRNYQLSSENSDLLCVFLLKHSTQRILVWKQNKITPRTWKPVAHLPYCLVWLMHARGGSDGGTLQKWRKLIAHVWNSQDTTFERFVTIQHEVHANECNNL